MIVQTIQVRYGGIWREAKIKTALKEMCSGTPEVDDMSCFIVSHDTQYEDAVPMDYLDYDNWTSFIIQFR